MTLQIPKASPSNQMCFKPLHFVSGSKTYEKTFQMNAVSELSRGSELCTQPKFNIIECQVKSGKEIIHKDYTYSYIFYDKGMIMKRTNPTKTLSTYSTYDRKDPVDHVGTLGICHHSHHLGLSPLDLIKFRLACRRILPKIKTMTTTTMPSTSTTMPKDILDKLMEKFMEDWWTRPT